MICNIENLFILLLIKKYLIGNFSKILLEKMSSLHYKYYILSNIF